MSKFDYEKVKNPLIFAENRVEAHSDHVCYASMEEWEDLEVFLWKKLSVCRPGIRGNGV